MPSASKKYLRLLQTAFVLLTVLVGACLLRPILPEIFGIATRAERKTQRQIVLQRIQTAGGWDALQKACIILAQANQDGAFQWIKRMGNTNNLPPALAARVATNKGSLRSSSQSFQAKVGGRMNTRPPLATKQPGLIPIKD